MGCKDYVELDYIKSVVDFPAIVSDDVIASMIHGMSDMVDEILGHSFNRAIRVWHEGTHGASDATVQVTTSAVVIVITGGPDDGTHSFAFATYTTLSDLVDAINDADIGVYAELLGTHSGWMESQPSSYLVACSVANMFGINDWEILCIDKLVLTLSGEGTPHLYLPLRISSVESVTVEGTALTAGTHYYVNRNGWLVRKGCTGVKSHLTGCEQVCCCHQPGCWACSYPCNVQVVFVPRWRTPRSKIGLALTQFVKNFVASTGFDSETIGRYAYRHSDEGFDASSIIMLRMLLKPLEDAEGLVLIPPP